MLMLKAIYSYKWRGRRQPGGRGRSSFSPLDFHTWYRCSSKKLKIVLFFRLSSVAPPPKIFMQTPLYPEADVKLITMYVVFTFYK